MKQNIQDIVIKMFDTKRNSSCGQSKWATKPYEILKLII